MKTYETVDVAARMAPWVTDTSHDTAPIHQAADPCGCGNHRPVAPFVSIKDRPVIYVAGYYTASPTHGTRNAMLAFDELLARGWLPLVPHVSLLLDIHSPHTPEFWYAYDIALMMRCDAVYVCGDPDTKRSEGVAREIETALRFGIPVFFDLIDAKDRYDH